MASEIFASDVTPTYAMGGIAIDQATNDVYVANTTDGSIIKITQAGVKTVFAFGLASPTNITFDSFGGFPFGYLYVLCIGDGTIYKIGVLGNIALFANVTSPFFAMAIFGNNLYYANTGANKLISIDLNLFFPTEIIDGGTYGISYMENVTIDSSGNLYISTANDGTIAKFDSTGTPIDLTFIQRPGYSILNMAFDSSGNIYVVSTNLSDYINYGEFIYKYDNTGTLLSATPIYDDPTQSILALALDTSERLYFSIDNQTGIARYNTGYIPPEPTPTPAPSIVSNVCLTADTPILTNKGYVSIANINPAIHKLVCPNVYLNADTPALWKHPTFRNKMHTKFIDIVAVTQTRGELPFLIRIEPHAIYLNAPSAPVIITPEHHILYNGMSIAAGDFIRKGLKPESFKVIPYNGYPLYNILTSDPINPALMIANGMIIETLHPNNIVARLYRSVGGVTPDKIKLANFITQRSKNKRDNVITPKRKFLM